MLIRWDRFNLYLSGALALIVCFLCSCHTTPESKHKAQVSTLEVHLETSHLQHPGAPHDRIETVSVNRAHPIPFTVEKEPFLREADVKQARVVDSVGGFMLQIEFGHQGALLLEQYSAVNNGKHLLIFSQFPDAPGAPINSGRWLAAPRINQRIADGVLSFTPDATREEANEIAFGLNNVAHQVERLSR